MTMLGVPKISGISPIEEQVNPTLWSLLTWYIKIYKDFIRPIQRSCLVYDHEPVIKGVSGTGWSALEFDSPEKDRGYFFISRLPDAQKDGYTFVSKGLDADRRYRLTFCSSGKSFRIDGSALTGTGFTVTLENPLTSELFLVEECE